MKLHTTVKRRRKALGLTQAELGGRFGWDRSQVCRLERGHVKPTLETRRKLAKALGLKLAEVLQ